MRKHWIVGIFVALVAVLSVVSSAAADQRGKVFASTGQFPNLQFPEGITAWAGRVYVGSINIVNPTDARVLVFSDDGRLLNTINGPNDQPLGWMNGLTINRDTGDLFIAGNQDGVVYRVHDPGSAYPIVSYYAAFPSAGFAEPPGPEDMAFNQWGELYITDSNNALLYEIAPRGCGNSSSCVKLVVGPTGSGAPINDKGLFDQVVPGLAPNGIVFNRDFTKLYALNTSTNAVIAFPVNFWGQINGPGRVFAQNYNGALEEYPTLFDGLTTRPGFSIGPQASTWLNGPDGPALDARGDVWLADFFGDNVTELSPTGKLIATYGNSAITSNGLLNNPASLTFVGDKLLVTQTALFTGAAGTTNSWSVVSFDTDVLGAGGNGNY
jgi:sugar lactone lactonase YvrE